MTHGILKLFAIGNQSHKSIAVSSHQLLTIQKFSISHVNSVRHGPSSWEWISDDFAWAETSQQFWQQKDSCFWDFPGRSGIKDLLCEQILIHQLVSQTCAIQKPKGMILRQPATPNNSIGNWSGRHFSFPDPSIVHTRTSRIGCVRQPT